MTEKNHLQNTTLLHIKIPHILKYGITHRRSTNANPNYKIIGDASLIGKREIKEVSINNGKIKTLGDFIPFYFSVRIPMLYVIQNSFNHTMAVLPENIVYILVKLQSIINKIVSGKYYFSDGHATDNLTKFYCADDIKDLPRT